MEPSLCTTQKPRKVPIDIDQWHDVFYRYQTTQLVLEYITDFTVMKNLAEFCSQIKCDPAHLCKYLRKHLHTQCVIRGSTYKLRGHHTPTSVSTVLDDYIHKYILCHMCGLPERKDDVCQSCGN